MVEESIHVRFIDKELGNEKAKLVQEFADNG